MNITEKFKTVHLKPYFNHTLNGQTPNLIPNLDSSFDFSTEEEETINYISHNFGEFIGELIK